MALVKRGKSPSVANFPATAAAGEGLAAGANLALRVAHQLHFAELAGHGVVHNQPPAAGVPYWARTLMASIACREPMTPTSGAITPASTQVRAFSPNSRLRQR